MIPGRWSKVILIMLILFITLSLLLIPVVSISQGKEIESLHRFSIKEDGKEMDCTKMMNLPVSVKKRLQGIYWRIYKDYTDMIETYYRAGALTWKQRETRLKMLKNYINTFYQRNYRWCSEHEPDEWEEEWYNIDKD